MREQSERRSLKAEERLQELLQGQASAEQEAQRVTQARQDLDDVRKKLDSIQTENLVSNDSPPYTPCIVGQMLSEKRAYVVGINGEDRFYHV